MNLIREINDGQIIKNQEDTRKYLSEFKNEDREFFIVLGLDTQNKVLYREVVAIGTLNKTIIHPREVFKTAITKSVHSIIIAHNHPSGTTNPSKEDQDMTKKLKACGELLDIKLLDSIIITSKEHNSIINNQ